MFEIYKVLSGSRLYGTNRVDSDYDYRCVVIDPISSLLGLDRQFETKDSKEGSEDVVTYGLKKFVGLALAANPNIIELLFVPQSSILLEAIPFRPFRIWKKEFLSQKIRKTFVGYAKGQLSLLEKKDFKPVGAKAQLIEDFGWDTKAGMRLYRICRQGYELLVSPDTYNPRLSNEFGIVAKGILNGLYSKDFVLKMCGEYLDGMESTKSILEMEPNKKLIENLLIETLRSHIEQESYFANNF